MVNWNMIHYHRNYALKGVEDWRMAVGNAVKAIAVWYGGNLQKKKFVQVPEIKSILQAYLCSFSTMQSCRTPFASTIFDWQCPGAACQC